MGAPVVFSLVLSSGLALLQTSAATVPLPSPPQTGDPAPTSPVARGTPALPTAIVVPQPSEAHMCLPPRRGELHVGDRAVTTIDFTITTQGTVADPTVARSSGHSSIDEQAKDCVAGWLYDPAIKAGQSVPFQASVEVGWIVKLYAEGPVRGSLLGFVRGITEQQSGFSHNMSFAERAVMAPVEQHPRYSCEHRYVGRNGVLVAYSVEPDGAVAHIAVVQSSGDAEEDKYAVECIAKRSYNPATQDGHPVETRLTARLY